MSDVPKPSRSKIQRYQLYLTDSDIEEELADDFSDDEYRPSGSEEDESENEGGDNEYMLFMNVSEATVSRPETPNNINVDAPSSSGFSPSISGLHQQRQRDSGWCEEGQLKKFDFTRNREFRTSLGSTPIDYFMHFVDEEFLIFTCNETNSYAERLFQSEGITEQSRITSWRPLAVPELKVFLGLLLHMGIISCSRIEDYWKTSRLFNFPIFREQMSRNRFLVIFRCLHFTSEENSDDPLIKIRKVIDHFNKKMDETYYPGKELSLDESMVLWRGRLKFRQFIKNKKYKYGIKLYMLTEPDGTILCFRVYTGSGDAEVAGKGHAYKVVMKLMDGKLQSGHTLYMDNFYNSYELAKKLLDLNTYCTGTLRKSLKSNPKEVVTKKLAKGENMSMYRDNVHVGMWKDKRPVLYLTTECENKMIPVANKRGQVTMKPTAIAQYNKFMSGIDRQDQMMAYYPCERKTLRWYKKLFVHTIQLMLVNSLKFYNRYSGAKTMTLFDFRLSIINSLLPESAPPLVNSRASAGLHTISKITEKRADGRRIKRKTCRFCAKKKKRVDTLFHCTQCPNQPGLCMECFDNYHVIL